MQIYFTDTSGQIYTVDILPDQTVGDLKVKLTDMTGARQMSILANGKPLSNEDIVGESLKNEATVTMAANLRGGSGDDEEDEEEEVQSLCRNLDSYELNLLAYRPPLRKSFRLQAILSPRLLPVKWISWLQM